jgi:hypothetical protein
MELNDSNLKLYSLRNTLLFRLFVLLMLVISIASCTVSYKFNGASIDYSKTKSISISLFPNKADLVHPPLSQEFTEYLIDNYTKQTRLQLIKKGGDLHLEGEIVGYQLTPMAISADTYASQTKLTLRINVRFTNHKNPVDNFERTYTAFQTFDSNSMISDVQDELLKIMIAEIADNIYNDTVAKW